MWAAIDGQSVDVAGQAEDMAVASLDELFRKGRCCEQCRTAAQHVHVYEADDLVQVYAHGLSLAEVLDRPAGMWSLAEPLEY